MRTRLIQIVATILLASTALAQEVPPPPMDVPMGTIRIVMAKATFATILVGDPRIVEINATTDRTFTLLPMSPGQTNVILLDARGQQIEEINVWVTEGGQGRVRIYKRAEAYSSYRCGPNGCELVSEQVSKQPPPQMPQTSNTLTTTTHGVDEYGQPTTQTRSRTTQ